MENLIEKDKYFALLASLGIKRELDYEYLYSLFSYAMSGLDEMRGDNPVVASMGVNPVLLTIYLVNEHAFYLRTHKDKNEEELKIDMQYEQFIASIAVDKYFTNEHLAYKMGTLTSRFSPAMSTLDLYLNFVLGMLARYKKNDPKQTLLVDVMNKGFQMAKCVATLLESGFETEAFSTWRTLHENECILQCLVKYGQKVIDRYLCHMKYAIAFRGGIKDKEETDAVFVEIKENMRQIGLKSKDMKRYIEYGWLTGVDNVMSIPDFKFNFRDGVERVAGLSAYSKVYEMSSEIAHSSPLLIYSKKDYFFSITLLNLYESFFRLEKFFSSLYLSSVSEEEKQRYLNMRNLYYSELVSAYNEQKEIFKSIGK
ncbi:MAG: DUF5677 domain-containing protein [Candidatus Enteromonas sp.]|nr:DUF5677 domain-containing protein [Candidatus Enteromonas sp.]